MHYSGLMLPFIEFCWVSTI
uniref:Uncharacterized protein n=1 Tax=Anguilla anguilla TaxID=7936 RepID=A0A0E9QGF8_ANGAN